MIWPAAALAITLTVIAGGCATTPRPEAGDGDHRIYVRNLEISFEHDSCGKLAGWLELFDLLDLDLPQEVTDRIDDALARRCPHDTEPEPFDLEIVIPPGACPLLHQQLVLAGAFDAVGLLQPNRRRMAAGFIDHLEDEYERQCSAPKP